jgi:hypothetical protein
MSYLIISYNLQENEDYTQFKIDTFSYFNKVKHQDQAL